jgi:hypothetical protein
MKAFRALSSVLAGLALTTAALGCDHCAPVVDQHMHVHTHLLQPEPTCDCQLTAVLTWDPFEGPANLNLHSYRLRDKCHTSTAEPECCHGIEDSFNSFFGFLPEFVAVSYSNKDDVIRLVAEMACDYNSGTTLCDVNAVMRIFCDTQLIGTYPLPSGVFCDRVVQYGDQEDSFDAEGIIRYFTVGDLNVGTCDVSPIMQWGALVPNFEEEP